MAKIIRLTEADLTRLVSRVIKEQSKVMTDKVVSSSSSSSTKPKIMMDKMVSSSPKINPSNGIPCIKQKFVFETYKITDPKILNKFQGLSSTPVLSEKNVLVYDKSNISLPEKKFGNVTLYSNGSKLGTINLDGTSIGDELYTITDVVMVDQGSDMFKIGWVFCNGVLYLYDIFGEKEKQNKRI
jgi:hypothetical protein